MRKRHYLDIKTPEWHTVRKSVIIWLHHFFGSSKDGNLGKENQYIADELGCDKALISRLLQEPNSDLSENHPDLPGRKSLMNMMARIILYKPTPEIEKILQEKWEARNAEAVEQQTLLQQELVEQRARVDQQQVKRRKWRLVAFFACLACLLGSFLFYAYHQSEKNAWQNRLTESQNQTATFKQTTTELQTDNVTLKQTITEELRPQIADLQTQNTELQQQLIHSTSELKEAGNYILLKKEADVHKAVYMFSKANIATITLAAYQLHDRVQKRVASKGMLSRDDKIAFMREVIDRLSTIVNTNRKEMQTITTRYLTRNGKSLYYYINNTVIPLYNVKAEILAVSPIDSLPSNATLFDYGVARGRPYFLSADTPKDVLARIIAEQVVTLQDKQIEAVLKMIEEDGGF